MKIVYCISSFYNAGGKERVISAKANYLADVLGYEVIIVTTYQRGKASFYPLSPHIRLVDMGIDYNAILRYSPPIRICLRRIYQHKHREKLEKFLINEQVDIAISTWSEELYFLSQLQDNSVKIVEYHCAYERRAVQLAEKKNILKRWKLLLNFKHEDRLLSNYRCLVVLTERDKKNWKTARNVYVIPNAIFSRPNMSLAPPKEKRVISVGRLEKEKGFERLINSWSIVKQDYPDWKLYIFGEGSRKKELQNQITNLGLNGIVYIHEPVNNILDEYQKSAFCVMTSYSEGFSMFLVEAMSCGLPAIAYDCPSGPSEIISHEEDGFLVSDGDSITLIKYIEYLIKNEQLRMQMGVRAMHNITRFSETAIMQQWKILFETIIKEKK